MCVGQHARSVNKNKDYNKPKSKSLTNLQQMGGNNNVQFLGIKYTKLIFNGIN